MWPVKSYETVWLIGHCVGPVETMDPAVTSGSRSMKHPPLSCKFPITLCSENSPEHVVVSHKMLFNGQGCYPMYHCIGLFFFRYNLTHVPPLERLWRDAFFIATGLFMFLDIHMTISPRSWDICFHFCS